MYKKLYARVLEALSLNPKSHLPATAPVLVPTSVGRCLVWIEPTQPIKRAGAAPHRVKVECLRCGQVLSAGRFEQHIARRDHQQQEVANAS